MKKPYVKFKINSTLDKWKVVDFLYRENKARVSFKKLILKTHPSLEKISQFKKEKAKNEIFKYIDQIYVKNNKNINKTTRRMQKDWRKIENEFFQITRIIFKNTPWPRGKYIAYLTISPPMPRFLETKTFQVGYTKDGRWKRTVAHEMLHFIFYEFIRRRYTPKLKSTDENKMNKLLSGRFILPLWDLSEVFNVIVLNEKEFQNLFPYPSKPYPQHKNSYKKLRKTWLDSSRDIDAFLNNIEANRTSNF